MAADLPAPGGAYAIEAGWLVLVVDRCTCSGSEYGHEPSCGREGVASLADVEAGLKLLGEQRANPLDFTSTPVVTDEMVEAFGQAWRNTPEGAPGDRRRAGLAAALAVR